MSTSGLLVTCVAGAATGAWIAYFRWKDKKHPEPLHLLIAATVAGVVSVAMSFFGFQTLDTLGYSISWSNLEGPWSTALVNAASIGAVEEGAKFLVILPIALWSTHFDEVWDGPVYAAAAGIGFALAETLYLYFGAPLTLYEGIARAVSAPIAHALFAVPMGLGLARAVLLKKRSALGWGLLVSIAVHGAYDLLLARPGLHIAAAGVIGALWLWLLFAGRELVKIPPVPRET